MSYYPTESAQKPQYFHPHVKSNSEPLSSSTSDLQGASGHALEEVQLMRAAVRLFFAAIWSYWFSEGTSLVFVTLLCASTRRQYDLLQSQRRKSNCMPQSWSGSPGSLWEKEAEFALSLDCSLSFLTHQFPLGVLCQPILSYVGFPFCLLVSA